MRLVLLSGGSGKRLWPLSNDARSKQFLKILKDEEGNLQSMVQRVWGQLDRVGIADSTVITTSKSQVDMIQSQLHYQSSLLIEPSRRDTFPAITLAASYLYTIKKVSLNEVVAVLPVDPYVQDAFMERVKDLENVIYESGADLALIGVKPTYPSAKYGYLIPQRSQNSQYIHVRRFIEKPTEEQANQLIAQGALWNCGVFAFRLGFIIQQLEEKGLPTYYDELIEKYEQLPKISFDYEVVENVENIAAITYEGYWKDLGTWNTLTEEMDERLIGNGIISSDSANTHLINELEIPVTILGVSNLIVAVSPDGILVADKAASPRIKELVSDFDNRPMYEERRWGWYRVLDYTKMSNGKEVLTKRIGIKAGCNISYQYHFNRSEVWTIIKGEGTFAHNDKLYEVQSGDVLKIDAGDYHCLKALSDIEMIEVQSGSELIEEDIVRVFMTWDEVEQHCYSINR